MDMFFYLNFIFNLSKIATVSEWGVQMSELVA